MTYTVICSKIINTKHDGEKYVNFRSYKHFSIKKFTALLLEGMVILHLPMISKNDGNLGMIYL